MPRPATARWCWFPGEASLGKSRLIAALEERLLEEQYFRLRYFCSPHHQDSALYPFVDQLGRGSGFSRDDLPASRLELLDILLGHAGMADEDRNIPGRSAGVAGAGAPRAAEPRFTTEKAANTRGAERADRGSAPARQQPVVVVFRGCPLDRRDFAPSCSTSSSSARVLPVLLIVTFGRSFSRRGSGSLG